MNYLVFALHMEGSDPTLILAQSVRELAFRIYGMKIEKPAQPIFLDPTANVKLVGRFNPADSIIDVDDETYSISQLLELASSSMMERAEVMPNE